MHSETGEIRSERRVRTASLGEWLNQQPASRVIVETCSEAFHVADQARAAGLEVRVVPATLVKSLGVGARGVKTDQRDARVLSELSCRVDLPSVHIPSETSRQIKALSGMRDGLITGRTKLINSVRGWLRALALRPRAGAARTFAARVETRAADRALELPRHVVRQLRSIEFLSEQIDEANRQNVQLNESVNGDGGAGNVARVVGSATSRVGRRS